MPDIVLATLNAKYAHAAFGLRYLLANLGPLRERACLLEFTVAERSLDVLEAILAQDPKIVGLGVYIWNVEASTRLVADLRRLRPEVSVVVGGPEVSHEIAEQEICRLADYVVTGEADLAFADLCERLLAGQRPQERVIAAELPEFTPKAALANRCVALPYELYSASDIAQRVVYVEASRGCPFKCEFCLSALDVAVRAVPQAAFLASMERLLARGLNQFKFVDRTFNLNAKTSRAILDFFLERYRPGLFLHFEMIPDRLPEALREPIRKFPAGALQFEVGIQSFNEAVCQRISRHQDATRVEDNLEFLRDQTGVHVHADLIVGLPGEDLDSFASGFDRLVRLKPQEIQVGILKRLRGTPITRHDAAWGMVYSAHPPYEVLQTSVLDVATLQRMRRFARFWDLVANSGNFLRTTPLIWRGGSPFWRFLALSDWLFARGGRSHAIALARLAEWLFEYLSGVDGLPQEGLASLVWDDYTGGGQRDGPEFLRGLVGRERQRARRAPRVSGLPERQARHLGK